MARGKAVAEFVGKLRSAFFSGITESEDQVAIKHAFERAVNDTLLGSNSEPKAQPKPRKKRRSRKPAEAEPVQQGE